MTESISIDASRMQVVVAIEGTCYFFATDGPIPSTSARDREIAKALLRHALTELDQGDQ